MKPAPATLLVLVTCPPDKARQIADVLVEKQYAACVNIIQAISSMYRWQDKIQRDDEALLLIKTAADRFDELRAAILSHHPYELPEIIAVSVAEGHAPYLDWILRSTRRSP